MESKSWRPGHWTFTKRRLFGDHVRQHMEWQLDLFLGAYEGAKVAAQLRAQHRAAESLARLREMGQPTLGGS